MKLAAGYIVFDGLETLERSIRSIRESVDLVIVSYQRISWGNTRCAYNLTSTLELLKAKGLIDEIMEFTNFVPSSLTTSNDAIRAKMFECMKRQSVLVKARELGATHYLSMDADEFYVKSQFDKAKKIIKDERLDATAVKYINYVTPTLHQGYSRFQVPFIYRLGPNSCHNRNQMTFGDIDPTRGVLDESHIKTKVFDKELITMHHMEMMRTDLLGKYRASSRFLPIKENIPILVEDIERSKTTGVLDYRRIHFGDSHDGLRETKTLVECKDQFGLTSLL